MLRGAFGLALMCCGLAEPARAHWQYTTWGMSPDQVVAASGGNVQRSDGAPSAQGDSTQNAKGIYAVNGASFDAKFYFRNAGLVTVSLSSHDGQLCARTVHDLQAIYGSPVESNPGNLVTNATWLDHTKNNRVKIIVVEAGPYCELQYSALVSAAGAGL